MASEVKVLKSACHMCHGGCGVLVHVQDGKVVKVEGDPDNPNNRGILCAKGNAAVDHLYNPNRILHPLKRVGERGEGKWERIGWDEALDTIASRLMQIRERWGPEAITAGDGTRGAEAAWIIDLLLYSLGSPNAFGSGRAQCFTPRLRASQVTYGRLHGPDYEGGPRCVVYWGAQPLFSNPNTIVSPKISRALSGGVKVVTIDPRPTPLARRATIWQRVRPATDGALALSWLNVIMKEGLYDREFVERWTNAPFLVDLATGELLREAEGGAYLIWDEASGRALPEGSAGARAALTGSFEVRGAKYKPVWQLLLERVEDFSPESVSEICWVPAETIREGARLYATTKPAAIHWGCAIDMFPDTHQVTRAVCILKAITGNLDVPGGNVYPSPPKHWMGGREHSAEAKKYIPDEIWERELGADRFRLEAGMAFKSHCNIPAVLQAILEEKPYPVKAMFLLGVNPILGWANSREVYEALKKVEFLVVADYYMTPSAEMADIFLPAATQFEKTRMGEPPQGCNRLGNAFTQKVIEPLGEARDDFQICGDILRRCGLGERWPWGSAEEFFEKVFRRAGLEPEEVAKRGLVEGEIAYRKYEGDHYRPGGGFDTPTGKAELYSTIYHGLGYDPLPHYVEPPESPKSTPELAKEFPLVLTTGGRNPFYFHTQYRQIERLRKRAPDPIFLIHPDTARKFGIEEGDWAWIESPRGRCQQRAHLEPELDPRVVHAEHGWWYPERPVEENLHETWLSNINLLTPNKAPFLDPGLGGYMLRGLLCRVYRA
ncbi:MAG: molybdopterin-dependent oxidoreductase [Nitrospinota bacterium]